VGAVASALIQQLPQIPTLWEENEPYGGTDLAGVLKVR
jgi:hypothetical protein